MLYGTGMVWPRGGRRGGDGRLRHCGALCVVGGRGPATVRPGLLPRRVGGCRPGLGLWLAAHRVVFRRGVLLLRRLRRSRPHGVPGVRRENALQAWGAVWQWVAAPGAWLLAPLVRLTSWLRSGCSCWSLWTRLAGLYLDGARRFASAGFTRSSFEAVRGRCCRY